MTLAGKFGAIAAIFATLAWIMALTATEGRNRKWRYIRVTVAWSALGLAFIFAIVAILLI